MSACAKACRERKHPTDFLRGSSPDRTCYGFSNGESRERVLGKAKTLEFSGQTFRRLEDGLVG